MSETAGEKTFAPTPKRRRDAAKKGDVLRSRELSTAAVILFGAAWLTFAGPWLLGDLVGLLRASLIFDRAAVMRFDVGPILISILMTVLLPLATLALPIMLLAVASQLGFSDGRWVPSNLNFKGSRLNPLSGLKRMFGLNGLIEMGKGLLKVGLLGSIAFAWGRGWFETIAGLGKGNLSQQLTAGWGALVLWAMHQLVDRRGWPALGRSLGVNAITAYAGSILMACLLSATGIWTPLYQVGFAGWLTPLAGDPRFASLAFAVAFVALWWGIARWMDRRGWHLKI